MEILKPDDVFDLAIQIEESGVKIYKKMAGIATDDKTRELFLRMSEEEGKHRIKFNKMRAAFGGKKGASGYRADDFVDLVKFLKKQSVFEAAGGSAPNLNNTERILDHMTDTEEASMVYYRRVKKLVDGKTAGAIDTIIKEEQGHIRLIEKIRKIFKK